VEELFLSVRYEEGFIEVYRELKYEDAKCIFRKSENKGNKVEISADDVLDIIVSSQNGNCQLEFHVNS